MKSPLSKNPILAFFGSFGLACVLLFFLFLLTLFGTLAQTTDGLYSVQKRYFESWYVMQPAGPLMVPLPGGALCIGLLSLNLLTGGLVRIRKSPATAGIIVVHIGIVVMMLAALVKWQFSDDGYLRLYEGQQSDSWVSWHDWEVAVWDAADTENVRELLIPDDHFGDLDGDRRRTFTSATLPFRIALHHYAENAKVLPKGPMWQAYGPTVEEYAISRERLAKENTENLPALHVEVEQEDGRTVSGILWGGEHAAWEVEAGGRRWAMTLRKQLRNMPFTIRLDDFRKIDHPGMSMAASFESDVTQVSPDSERQVLIQMNEPLRDGGLVLFQSSWGPSNARPGEPLFSVFSVARNPSDQWPLISCVIISIGLLWAFGRRLLIYVRSQKPARQARHPGAARP